MVDERERVVREDAGVLGALGRAVRLGDGRRRMLAVRRDRHDLGAAIDQVINRRADARMIEGDDCHAVEVTDKGFERASEHGGIENVGCDQLDREAARREPARHFAEIGLDLLHEQVRAGRRHENEAPGPAAGQIGRSHMGLKGVALDRLLDAAHRVGAHDVRRGSLRVRA